MQDASPSAGPIDLGRFTLDERSGELRCGESGAVGRLAPQPARLLAHLIRRRPEIVSRDEIRELLWPDVEVDLEAGVHTCIRQIRAALSDPAGAPRYVETIPRRGYRYVGPVVESAPGAAAERSDRWYRARSVRLALVAGALLAVPLVGLVVRTGVASVSPQAPVRIAIMPFEPIDASSPLPPANAMAEELVRILTARGAALEIVGPTTTEMYDGASPRLRELIDTFAIDYVINARHTGNAGTRRILVEVIRATDGAHVWAEYLDTLDQPARTISDAALASLAADRPRGD